MTVATKFMPPPLLEQLFQLAGSITVDGLSTKQFKELTALYPELQMERSKNGKINIMSPVKGGSGIREVKLSRRIGNWCEEHVGGEVFSPSTGFDLPDGSTKSPDVSWLSAEKMDALSADEIENQYIPTVPDFIVELRSKSDKLTVVKRKMEKTWIANGVQLAWLIDPYKEKVYIYRADGSIDIVTGFDNKLSGESVLQGFVLDLSEFKVFKKKQ